MSVHVPDGFALTEATSSGVDVGEWSVADDGEVVTLTFVPQQTGELTLSLTF